MKHKAFVRTVLAYHGYEITKYRTSRTGTNDGQSEDKILYDIEAAGEDGDVIELYNSGFNDLLYDLFQAINSRNIEVKNISQEQFLILIA